MKKTNVYVSVSIDNNGLEHEGALRVLADNRKAAADLLRCPVEFVRFKGQERRSDLQRHGDHAAKMPAHSWADRVWAVRRAPATKVVVRK